MKSEALTISFLSGKGGVGKSLIIANLARIFSETFSTTLIWDNNLQFPIQHFLNAVDPNVRLFDVIENNFSIEKALVKVSNNIFLVGGAGNYPHEIENSYLLTKEFFKLNKINDFDIVLIDNPSGFQSLIIDFAKIVDFNLVFLTEDPTSVFDSYGLVKILYRIYGVENILLVVNNVVDYDDGKEIAEKFNLATRSFLGVEFPLAGIIPYERNLKPTFFNQQIYLENTKDGEFYSSMKNLAENVLNLFYSQNNPKIEK